MNLLPPSTRSVGRRGFTLNEVLVALGILAIGSVAVASLFPTAAFLQKEAVKETLRQNHIRSADAVLEGVGLNNRVLLEFVELVEREGQNTGSTYPVVAARPGIDDPAYDVFALAEVDTTVWTSFDDPVDVLAAGVTIPEDETGGNTLKPAGAQVGTPDMRMGGSGPAAVQFRSSYIYESAQYGDGRFPMSFRSLPTIQPRVNGTYADREVFWVPLVRAGVEASELFPDWNVYVFVLQPDSQLRTNGVYALGNYPDFNNATIICANPESPNTPEGDVGGSNDPGNYFPKVFRVPVTWKDTDPNVAVSSIDLYGYIKPGEKILGDNGKIYRVADVESDGTAPHRIALSPQTFYEPINERELGAVWVAPAPGGINQDSPLADIRLLSNTVVRTNDF